METAPGLRLKHSSPICVAVSIFLVVSSVQSKSPSLGIHPLDEKYFDAEVIKCKDGSKSFTRDRLNDNFCDCIDGTDEPGTSACPAGKFYCRNVGSIPRLIFSSRVNDRFCDCCDGSDEYDGGIMCPNTCIMGGNIEYKSENHVSATSHLHSTKPKERKIGINLDDLIQMLAGHTWSRNALTTLAPARGVHWLCRIGLGLALRLKMITVAELALGCFLVVRWIYYKRVKSKKRHHR